METMKVAIVTGAAAGIGRATAEMLLERGYAVVGLSRRSAESVLPTFASWGDRFTYVSGDVSVAADREALLQAALEHYGRVDVLVNVAGVAPKVRRDLLEMTEESFDTVMDINTRGLLFLTQAVVRQMLTRERPADGSARGYVVNTSSVSAYTSSVSRGEYCISKAGVSMITMLFADRLAAEGILCNEVCPGIIATDMTAAVQEKYDRLIEGGLVPTGRWGQPEDVARAILALCDGTFPYTTGQSITVDGGLHIRRL
jgi:NAD(P)-dependent dehydrogenase (short-subunit alcohol dehydrogenase family)